MDGLHNVILTNPALLACTEKEIDHGVRVLEPSGETVTCKKRHQKLAASMCAMESLATSKRERDEIVTKIISLENHKNMLCRIELAIVRTISELNI